MIANRDFVPIQRFFINNMLRNFMSHMISQIRSYKHSQHSIFKIVVTFHMHFLTFGQRKLLVFGVSDQPRRLKSTCSATEASQKFEISDIKADIGVNNKDPDQTVPMHRYKTGFLITQLIFVFSFN